MNSNIMRLHAYKFLFLICLVFIAFTVRAAGVCEFVIPPDPSGPEISALIWTPCKAADESLRLNDGPPTIRGVKDCAVEGKNLPLVVISHGLYGDSLSHHDTAEFLADAGFVVVAFSHTQDSSIEDKRADSISSILVRPVDVKRVIDFVLGSSRASANIDARRIGFFGFSRGGYTGLVLAGAVPDFPSAPFPCPETILLCRQILQNDIPDPPPGYEPRIKAFVIADPLSFFPDKISLQEAKAPIQLWSSDRGGMGARPEDVASVAKNLPNAPEFHRPANSAHLSFLFPCSAEEAKLMPPVVCTDPPGFDRTDFHRKFNAQVLEFFRDNLTSGNGS